MRVCTWNMRRATKSRDDLWEYFLEIDADIAFLQEVGSIPLSVSSHYSIMQRKALGKNGQSQRFYTAVLVRGSIDKPLNFSTSWNWVNEELRRFEGNLVSAEITLVSGKSFRLISVYSPAWPIDRQRLKGIDVSEVKLKNNPDIWLTEILWAVLSNEDLNELPWIVAGDLNSSITFDMLWNNGPRGNQEIQDRMSTLGFIECLRFSQGKLTPTFRNPRGGKVIHQMDHLFVSEHMTLQLLSCMTGDARRVFGNSLSDHLPIIAEFKKMI
ncbi:MAG: endonuclease/exonuclease/phosphatase family protein [Bacteroidales bacterium]|nr:endonuclease/exonuclease/phosphatase family protein [Bacteroidales bacterium]